MKNKSMENFFNPHSVAIFASMKEGKTGYERRNIWSKNLSGIY